MTDRQTDRHYSIFQLFLDNETTAITFIETKQQCHVGYAQLISAFCFSCTQDDKEIQQTLEMLKKCSIKTYVSFDFNFASLHCLGFLHQRFRREGENKYQPTGWPWEKAPLRNEQICTQLEDCGLPYILTLEGMYVCSYVRCVCMV